MNLSEKQEDIKRFILNSETRFLHLSQPPCYKMKFSTKRVDHWKRNNATKLYLNIIDEVTVITDTYAYDMFSLVVDLGSALGLWLGLSALDIFGSILEFLGKTKLSLKSKTVKKIAWSSDGSRN